MKKILLAFDGTHFSEGAVKFAAMIHRKGGALRTGVFLPQVNFANLWSYASAAAGVGTPVIPLLEDEDLEIIQQNIDRFESLCQRYNIPYRVHKDYNDFAVPQLVKESRFADLLIVGCESFYEGVGGEPNAYLKELLHLSECPVIVVPEQFTPPDSVVLTYDGSASSVYAIKQFAYLFPELTTSKTLLVFVEEEEKTLPEETNIKELVQQHFPDCSVLKVQLPKTGYFSAWVSERQNSMLVSGSFGRSAFSQLFRKSFVSDVIRDHLMPVFVAHR
jgi:nucleotide-binding universal stress UspA family protein